MAGLTAFEVQTYRNGGWKIETITDDMDMAIFEAQRLARSPHISKVRVVEETFDPATDLYRSKVVFRREKTAKRTARPAPSTPKPNPDLPPKPTAAPAANPGRPKRANSAWLIVKLSAIIFGGIALIVSLRFIAQAP